MAKKSALFLAGIALAGCLVCSFPIVQNTGDFEPLKVKRAVVPSAPDVYNPFRDCVIVNTLDFDSDTFSGSVRQFTSFGSWGFNYNSDYINLDETSRRVYNSDTFIYTNIGTSLVDVEEIGNNDLWVYDRFYYVYGESNDSEGDPVLYESSVSRIYSPSPFIVPLALLRQFILGLYWQSPDDPVDFIGNFSVYRFEDHWWDTRSLSLRTLSELDESIPYSISPSSFDSIFSDTRYLYYDDLSGSNFDPLSYSGPWVFVSFDFAWTNEDPNYNDVWIGYTNSQVNDDYFNLVNTTDYSNLVADTSQLWYRVFGDTVYLEPINPPDIIFGTVEGFLATEFIPAFSFGDLLLIVLGVMVFGAFLKVFLGG